MWETCASSCCRDAWDFNKRHKGNLTQHKASPASKSGNGCSSSLRPCSFPAKTPAIVIQWHCVSTAILMMRNAYIFHPATAPEAGTPSSWAFQRPLKRRRRRDDTYLLEKPLDSFARSLLGTPAIVADGGGGGEGARPWAFTKTTERVNEYHVLYICMHVCLCM